MNERLFLLAGIVGLLFGGCGDGTSAGSADAATICGQKPAPNDGGACSPTSLDLLAGMDLDEVLVLAPMVSFEVAPSGPRCGSGHRFVIARRASRQDGSRSKARVRHVNRWNATTMYRPDRVVLPSASVPAVPHCEPQKMRYTLGDPVVTPMPSTAPP